MAHEIAHVATRSIGGPDDGLHVRPYVDGEVYQIDDLHPWIHFASDARKSPAIPSSGAGFVGRGDLTHDQLTWWKWCPLASTPKEVSAERRFGYYEVELGGSWRARLRCYVWPARLFDRSQMVAMIRAVGTELGRTIVWERSRSPVRAYVTAGGAGRVDLQHLLSRCDAELKAVAQLEHAHRSQAHGDLALHDSAVHGPGSPEDRLIALWGLRRLRQLMDYRRTLKRSEESHTKAMADYAGNPARVEDHGRQLREVESILSRVLRAEMRVRLVGERYAPARGALELMPAMQRDHRLRRLFAAFRSPTQERIADEVARLSTLPPIKAPELFELWGAVRMIQVLRAQGWRADPPALRCTSEEWGVAALDGCTWHLTRGDERIEFEFSPRPRIVDMEGLPEAHDRVANTWMWAASRLEPGDDTLFSLKPSTPDYVLRWSSGSRHGLVIGDASLADPEHQKGKKVDKVCEYRRQVAWRIAGGTIVTCSLRGSFILLPGPPSRWRELSQDASAQDCYLLCPQAGADEDREFAARIHHLIDNISGRIPRINAAPARRSAISEQRDR